MAFAFGRATPSLRQPPSRCLDNPVPGNIIFSLNGEHHLLLKVLHFRVDKREQKSGSSPERRQLTRECSADPRVVLGSLHDR